MILSAVTISITLVTLSTVRLSSANKIKAHYDDSSDFHYRYTIHSLQSDGPTDTMMLLCYIYKRCLTRKWKELIVSKIDCPWTIYDREYVCVYRGECETDDRERES